MLTALVVLQLLESTVIGEYLGSEQSGISTYYGGNENGNACGYDHVDHDSFPFGFYAACGGNVFDDGKGCGKCYEITCVGPSGNNPSCECSGESVIVSCMDQCPECSDTHFDLVTAAMEVVVPPELAGTCGIIETTVRRVSCDYTGNLIIRSKTGTSAWWYGLHIDDIANYGSVQRVLLKSSGSSSWNMECFKDQPSFWLCSGSYPMTAPLSVQLTDDNGETIECDGCITHLGGGSSFNFGTNFGSGESSTATASTQSSPSPVTAVVGSSDASSTDPIVIELESSTQMWWLMFFIRNSDASSCGDFVDRVYIRESGEWRQSTQVYDVDGDKKVGFDHNGISFTDLLPISLALSMDSGRVVFLWGIITDISPPTLTFTSSEFACE